MRVQDGARAAARDNLEMKPRFGRRQTAAAPDPTPIAVALQNIG
jgi:hypothetical protein